MVDVNKKALTQRHATARAKVRLDGPISDAYITAASVAAIFAAKKTQHLIPLCHPIPVDDIELTIEQQANTLMLEVTVSAVWKTGVEMESLVGVTAAALTLLAAVNQQGRIDDIAVWTKSGGKSGVWGRSVSPRPAHGSGGDNDSDDEPYNDEHS